MKTETKVSHTPGPWRLEEIKMPNGETVINVLAQCENGDYYTIINHLDAMHADCKLIVAAPELLEACKIILSTLSNCGYGGKHIGLEKQHEKMLEKLIVKAEGGE